jgi:hypothetical protein
MTFRLLGAAGCIFLAWGCGAASGGPNGGSILPMAEKAVPEPDWRVDSDLRLLSPTGDARIGDPVESARKLFPKPEVRAAAFQDLPPGFGPGFSSSGWETDAEGYGIISLGARTVVAMHMEMGVGESRVNEIVSRYRRRLPSKFAENFDLEKPHASHSWVRYWFAEENGHRLMVCAVRLEEGVLNVTEALGTEEALDALRMSPRFAAEDIQALKNRPAERTGAKPN